MASGGQPLLVVLCLSLSLALSAAGVVPMPQYHCAYTVGSKAAEPTTPVTFHLQLRTSGAQELFQAALAVSDPGSPRYGSFLSVAEIEAMTAPNADDVAAVTGWLENAGVCLWILCGGVCRVCLWCVVCVCGKETESFLHR